MLIRKSVQIENNCLECNFIKKKDNVSMTFKRKPGVQKEIHVHFIQMYVFYTKDEKTNRKKAF